MLTKQHREINQLTFIGMLNKTQGDKPTEIISAFTTHEPTDIAGVLTTQEPTESSPIW